MVKSALRELKKRGELLRILIVRLEISTYKMRFETPQRCAYGVLKCVIDHVTLNHLTMTANPKALPDEETIQKAAEHEIYDLNGNKVKFGSLFAEQKTIIVFIRAYIPSSSSP